MHPASRVLVLLALAAIPLYADYVQIGATPGALLNRPFCGD